MPHSQKANPRLPSLHEIEQLHRKYAPTDAVFELVFTHCTIVCEIAGQLIARNKLNVQADVVRVGCLLHDIGVYTFFNDKGIERTDVPYITHGIRGEDILRREGFPELIWRFASHHTGVGLTKEDIISQKLPLPFRDYVAATAEERLVMYADKFHSKTNPPQFNSYNAYRTKVANHGQQKTTAFDALAKEFGVPDLAPLIAKYGYELE